MCQIIFRRDHEVWNYNDEAQQRVDAYDGLIRQVDELYGRLPVELKDSFFQMVLYEVCRSAQ